jgi:UDP-glucose 4-epimerase
MKKTVLVTGGAGFVGSHLCERLVNEGNRVISLDNYFTGTPNNHVEGVEYRTGHTKDIAALIPETPDIVFHLGEYARTEKSFEDIELVWDLNKTGTFAVLEFCRRKECKIIYAGSSTKFADGGEGRDQSPYAWSKATNAELVKNYSNWFGLQYAITYFYNVYGPREMSGSFGTVVGIFTEQFRHGQPLMVTSPGTQARNFTHVSDIVDGLLLVAEKGQGDNYGIGANQAYSVLELAKMFGGEYMMQPERQGNRLTSEVNNEKVTALGWVQKNMLPDWIQKVKTEIGEVKTSEKRILVYTTTFLPDAGPAEHSLVDVMRIMPNIHFDVVTTLFSKDADTYKCELPNVSIHRVGKGNTFDKYLLPLYGAKIASQLFRKHDYMFRWALFASYGALTAVWTKTKNDTPLLITMADHSLGSIPWRVSFVLKFVLGKADQVYTMDTGEAQAAITLSKRSTLIRSIGQGDAFANQVRFIYANFLRQRFSQKKHT